MDSFKQLVQWSCVFVAVFLLFFGVLFSIFHFLLFDQSFYAEQFEKNGVYAKYGETVTLREANEILKYIEHSEQEKIDSAFFSKRDKDHMVDVRVLIHSTYTLKYTFMVVFVLLLCVYYFLFRDRFFLLVRTVFVSAGGLLVGIPLVSYVLYQLIPSLFSDVFLAFHKTFFTNDLWILDPAKDNLINFFPEPFFYTFLVRILLYGVVIGVIFILSPLFLQRLLVLLRSLKGKTFKE